VRRVGQSYRECPGVGFGSTHAWIMLGVLHAVLRILAGWFGISLIATGLWVLVAMSMNKVNKPAVITAGILLLIGAGLIWVAFSLL
jgi:hypothetical protein